MGRTHLGSSLIEWIDHDDTATLTVAFTSGTVYRYFVVPKSIVDGLVDAPSAGAYFNDHIRDHYRFDRIE